MLTRGQVTEVKRVGKFSAIGVINTLLDFTLYNLFTGPLLQLSLIQANLLSTSLAMIFSFFANKTLVFQAKGGSLVRQALVFFTVTAFGLYVLQNGVIKLLVDVWPEPLNLAVAVVELLQLDRWLSADFVIKNGAKAAATLVSLTWNYLMYKKVVFKG